MHTLAATVLAFGWNPEIRGLTTVVIGIVALCGSVYLLLATNLGTRLGFLVAFAGLFGWMTIMGGVWWAYGIGLKGSEPSWKAQEIIIGDLSQARSEVLQDVTLPASPDVRQDGWLLLPGDDPGRGQATAAADEIILNEAKIFTAGQYQAQAVYDYGGLRHPVAGPYKVGNQTVIPEIDFLAFFHDARYSLVEVRPVVPQNTEPGKAPPAPIVDENADPVYVLMLRDLGSRREPAAAITIGSGIIFLVSILALNRRDRILVRHREEAGAAS
jgi:hypothetical protein